MDSGGAKRSAPSVPVFPDFHIPHSGFRKPLVAPRGSAAIVRAHSATPATLSLCHLVHQSLRLLSSDHRPTVHRPPATVYRPPPTVHYSSPTTVVEPPRMPDGVHGVPRGPRSRRERRAFWNSTPPLPRPSRCPASAERNGSCRRSSPNRHDGSARRPSSGGHPPAAGPRPLVRRRLPGGRPPPNSSAVSRARTSGLCQASCTAGQRAGPATAPSPAPPPAPSD